MKTYQIYEKENITKELLNTIKTGDLIKVNDWKKPMRVIGVSENFFIMRQSFFKDYLYSICEKNKRGYEYNLSYQPHRGFAEDEFICGPDNMIFGIYDYAKDEDIPLALEALENGEIEVSQRRGLGIHHIEIKRV
jgi:hypothetical protein